MHCTNCGTELTGTPRYCPTCGSPVTPSSGADDAGAPARKGFRVGWVIFPLVLSVGLLLFLLYLKPSVHEVIAGQPVVAAGASYGTTTVSMTDIVAGEENGEIVFPLDDLLRAKLVRFEVQTPTTTRPVMAYLTPDGRVVTSISVSEHCGSSRFAIKENRIYCANCASQWDMMTMEAYACCAKYYPDPIPNRLEGGKVRISRSIIEKWAGRL